MTKRLTAIVGLLAALTCTGCATGITGPQGLVSQDSAEIRGQVATDTAGSVEYWFEYGPTTAYGSESPHETWPNLQPGERGEVGFKLEGLSRSTVYHYRVCAQDATQKGGPGCGEDRTVTTQSFACGETVTTDVRFTGSVWCQNAPEGSNGLVIGAPGITIDMYGYNLQGPGNTTGAAIDNSGGFDDVTIRGVDNVAEHSGSTLAGYVDDIRLRNASGNRVIFLRTAVDIAGGSGNEVRRSLLHNKGLHAQNTSGLVVADNAGGFGSIELTGVLDSRILRNRMNPPSWWYCCTDGIRIAGNRNVIRDNSLSNWSTGIDLVSGAENKLLDNYVVQSKADGILVQPFTAGTVLRGNRLYENADDGIEVQSTGASIGYNHTFANGDYGIDAIAGVTDSGGNTATDNGNPAQCRNVFCAPESP